MISIWIRSRWWFMNLFILALLHNSLIRDSMHKLLRNRDSILGRLTKLARMCPLVDLKEILEFKKTEKTRRLASTTISGKAENSASYSFITVSLAMKSRNLPVFIA